VRGAGRPGGFFYSLGRLIGPKLRKATWIYQSLTGTEAESIEAEDAVGRDLARSILQQLPLDPDPAVRQSLAALGQQLAGCVRRQRRFHFQAVQTPEINAFALPGGYVFVTRPLLELCAPDRDAQAFILGHEMGHVLRRHAIERIMAQTFFKGFISRLPIGGGLLRPQIAALLTMLLNQGYSQDQELEADATGVELVRAAGFAPEAARRVLATLSIRAAAEPLLGSYFASHPALEVRLAHLDRCLREIPPCR
jgi:predicted Zn-dependent protease